MEVISKTLGVLWIYFLAVFTVTAFSALPAAAQSAPGETEAGEEIALQQGDPVRGEKLFRACRNCHSLSPDGGNIVGPGLYGLFNRKAGTYPGYNYSKALKSADFRWNETTLDKLFALGPNVFTPGSKMPLQEMPDPRDRADLIAYLKRATGGGAADAEPAE